MGRNKNLKSGVSLLAMLVCMAVIASVFGYFISSWFLDYVAAPESGDDPIVEEEVVETTPEIDSGSEEEEFDSNVIPDDVETIGQDTERDIESDELEGDASGLYVVQVGAFGSAENAQAKVEILQERGFNGYITSENPYRVQVGAFESKEAAEQLGQELEEKEFSVYISN